MIGVAAESLNGSHNLAFNLAQSCSSAVLTVADLHAEVNALNTAMREDLHANLNNAQAALDKGHNRVARTRLAKLVNRSNFASTNPNNIPLAEANNLVCGAANVLGGIAVE